MRKHLKLQPRKSKGLRAGQKRLRKRMEEELERLAKDRLLLLESTDQGIYGIDLRAYCAFVNRSAADMLGYAVEELLGRNMHEVLHHSRPDGSPYPQDNCPIYQASKDGKGCRVDHEVFWRKDGSSFPVEYSSHPIVEDGTTKGAVVVFTDITQRKRAEEALRENEARYRTVLRATNDVIWEWDLKTNALWWSDNFFELFGYRPDEIEPGAESWSTRLHPDERDRILSEVHAVIQNRQQFWSGEYRLRRADGSYVHVYDRGYITFDESGAPARMTGAFMDITARKQAEEALWKREEQLWQLLGERGQLSQDLHDNIIQKIYAIGLNLEESTQLLTEDSDAAARNLKQAVADLNGVIREVRNYIDRIDPGPISTARLRIELAQLVQGSQGALLPQFRLRLDPITVSRLNTEQARQVLFIAREALSNSLRHSHARTGFVSLRTQDDCLRLEIADDGVGFDSRQGNPSGHGLRNMAARAQKLGGRLEVISAPGQGTRIIVDIPKEYIHA